MRMSTIRQNITFPSDTAAEQTQANFQLIAFLYNSEELVGWNGFDQCKNTYIDGSSLYVNHAVNS